jgi:hypothetical protein
MSGILIFSALAMLAVAGIVKWYLVRKWARYYANPKYLVFPKMCPVCLSYADTTVEEESAKRQTANYIVARRLEWWRAKIPHCARCQRKQDRNLIIGLVVGAACSITVFIFKPPPEPDYGIVLYILFGYPTYVFATTLQKGVVFGWATSTGLSMRIRRSEYFDKLLAVNASDATAGVPLAGNKGVWRH